MLKVFHRFLILVFKTEYFDSIQNVELTDIFRCRYRQDDRLNISDKFSKEKQNKKIIR
jgi:hypothetical protein